MSLRSCGLHSLNIARRAGPSVSLRLRASSGIARKIQFPQPDQAVSTCPVLSEKIFWFSETANHLYIRNRPTPLEGRIAIVTDAGLDAMAASGASDESVLLADGKIVWS